MSQLSEALKSFDTSYLTKAKNELIHAIPGDATFTSHVGMILRALLQHELGLRAQAAAPSANTGIVPQKLAEDEPDEPAFEAGPDAGAHPSDDPPPPTPSTRAAPPRPKPPAPPRDW